MATPPHLERCAPNWFVNKCDWPKRYNLKSQWSLLGLSWSLGPAFPEIKCGKQSFDVSGVLEDSEMFIGPLQYEHYLTCFADIYYLLGTLEIRLRRKLPIALSNLADANGYSQWFDVLPNTKENQRALATAFERNSQTIIGIEDFLPFSFWSHLFQRELYSVLWTPCLYKVFNGLRKPQSKSSFRCVSRNMRRASRIRNRVAHFNLANAGNHEEEVSVLNWLINAMGGPSA